MKKILLGCLSVSLISFNSLAEYIPIIEEANIAQTVNLNENDSQDQELAAKQYREEALLKKRIQADENLLAPYVKKDKIIHDSAFRNFLSNFYFKFEAGAGRIQKIKDKNIASKLTSNTKANFGLGIGAYYGDSSRLELDIGLFNNLKLAGSNKTTSSLGAPGSAVSSIFGFELKRSTDALSADKFVGVGLPEDTADAVVAIIQESIAQFQRGNNSDITIKQIIAQNVRQFGQNAQTINTYITNAITALNSQPETRNLYSLLTNDPGISTTSDISRKSNVMPIMLSVYMNLAEFNRVKFFAGLGVGAARITEKTTLNANVGWPSGESTIFNFPESSKKTVNFAWAVSLGGSIDLTEKIHVDIKGSFKDFGRTKSRLLGATHMPGIRYQAYIATAGLRIDL